MAKRYTSINLDALYTWISKVKHHKIEADALIQEKGGTVSLVNESDQLKRELRDYEEEIVRTPECERFSVNTNFLCFESAQKEKAKQCRYALDN